MEGQQEDLEDVIREERSRGRRPVDTKALREKKLLREGFLRLIREGDERKFLSALRALGLREGSAEFLKAVRIWRETHRR